MGESLNESKAVLENSITPASPLLTHHQRAVWIRGESRQGTALSEEGRTSHQQCYVDGAALSRVQPTLHSSMSDSCPAKTEFGLYPLEVARARALFLPPLSALQQPWGSWAVEACCKAEAEAACSRERVSSFHSPLPMPGSKGMCQAQVGREQQTQGCCRGKAASQGAGLEEHRNKGRGRGCAAQLDCVQPPALP